MGCDGRLWVVWETIGCGGRLWVVVGDYGLGRESVGYGG